MRPGNRWNGEAANPIAAAILGAVASLVVAYGLCYLSTNLGVGVLSGPGSWLSRSSFMLAGLNLYAAQHVALHGTGVLPEMGRIHATVTLPLTVWAAVPAMSLLIGGFVAARCRVSAGRWRMIAPAILGGLIYVAVMAGVASLMSAKFTSAALPAIRGTEFNPPDLSFRPSLADTLAYGSLFAILFTYLGALLAVRKDSGPKIPGKWWACAKAVVTIGVVVQLLFAGGAWAWLTLGSSSDESGPSGERKVAEVLPAVAGIAYSAMHGARVSYAAVPTGMPGQSYSADIGLYRGVTTREGDKVTHKRLGPYVWAVALIAELAALLSGRLAVRMGSRDGSIPTAFRIVIIQSAYLATIMLLCRLGWGITGQFELRAGPGYDSAMLIAATGIFVFAFIGAHWGNRRYAGRLSGFPAV